MKTGKLLGMLLFVLGTFSLMGCNDEMTDEEEGWYDSIPDGNFFSRGNTVRFYYIDGNGNSLIKPEDKNTLPVSWREELVNPIERTEDYSPNLLLYGLMHTVCRPRSLTERAHIPNWKSHICLSLKHR